MSNRLVKKVLTTVLVFTMMWGMCISASAETDHFNAKTHEEAIAEAEAYLDWLNGIDINTIDSFDGIDINSLPEGYWLDSEGAQELEWFKEDIVKHCIEYWEDCEYKNGNLNHGDTTERSNCEIEYDDLSFLMWKRYYIDYLVYSDGSKYVENDGSCGDSTVSGNSPSVSGNDIPKLEDDSEDKKDSAVDDSSSVKTPENDFGTFIDTSKNDISSVVVVKTPENDFGTFMDTSKNDISRALGQLNQAIASGDTKAAQRLRETGVTIDTGVWYSFNLSVYEQIEKSGIPVTLKFTYKGQRYSVTIPAGAKVTELCDEKGWCGFLNLAAQYGFELL